MTAPKDGYTPGSFRELSAWVGAAGAPAQVEVTFDGQGRRESDAIVRVDVTRALLTAWAKLAYGMETLGLRYAESRRDTGLSEPGGVLVLARDEHNGGLLIGWETAQGIQVASTPVAQVLQGIADACHGQISAIRLQAGSERTASTPLNRDRPQG